MTTNNPARCVGQQNMFNSFILYNDTVIVVILVNKLSPQGKKA